MIFFSYAYKIIEGRKLKQIVNVFLTVMTVGTVS